MSSSTTLYRINHPEYYEKEKIRDNERMKLKYSTNEEYREKVKKRALESYYKKKQQKQL
jgi:hypothetical protein